MAQAAGSWSRDACCAVPDNDCDRQNNRCIDRASSSGWLFGLLPGPPQRFEPTGNDNGYQVVWGGGRGGGSGWPQWGSGVDLAINAPYGWCSQGGTYRGKPNEICGGYQNWGATDVEVWYPR